MGDAMALDALVLTTAFRHTIHESDVEAGFARFVALTGQAAAYDTFCEAITNCVRDGMIRDPVRLPQGALQCHWHLELTTEGVAAARALLKV